jgi:group I intron endonuclease
MNVVYEIVCNPTMRKYFGRSQEVEKRWRSHRNMLRKNEHPNTEMQRDWSFYGEAAFSFNVLFEQSTKEVSLEVEQTLIDLTRGLSYNIANADSGGDTFTHNPRQEEIRRLKSRNSRGANNPMYGKEKNELTIRRIKEANSKPISVDGVQYGSLTEASAALGVNVTTVAYRLNSDSLRFKGWVYVDKEMPNDYRNHAG